MSSFEVTRRQAIKSIGTVGLAVLVGACSTKDLVSTVPLSTSLLADTTPLAAFPLKLRMWAEPATAEIIAGVSTDVLSFGAEVLEGDARAVVPNDSYLGPTLRFRQGQRVQVSFENRLDAESIVHWHGLYVPQDQDGQPAEAVGPGETYEYDFVVTNSPGTYWYHPHPHGQTGEQVYQGLAGLLIIEETDSVLPSGDNDIALVLQDRSIDESGQLVYIRGMHDEMAGFVGATLVTNGVADFTMTVKPEPYRVRILNGANSRTPYLRWSNGDSFHVVATDGDLLPETVSSDGLVITPAQRSDVWVDFSAFNPGDELQLLTADTFTERGSGLALGGEIAATFIIADSPASSGTLPQALGAPGALMAADAVNSAAPKEFVLSTRRAAHWINDSAWEGRSVSAVETVEANTVELWEFVNRSPMAHPMHLHGKAFQVVSRSWDDEGGAASWGQIEDGIIETGLRDTVLVWPGQRVQIAVPFGDLKGYFLYHCHILEHEDRGMMRNFRVI